MLSERDQQRIDIAMHILKRDPKIGFERLTEKIDRTLNQAKIGQDARGDLNKLRSDGRLPTPPPGGGVITWKTGRTGSKVFEVTFTPDGRMAKMEKKR